MYQVLPWLGLLTPITVFLWLDKNLREDLRKRYADAIYGSTNEPIKERIILLNIFVQKSLGNSKFRKIITLSVISIISIVFIFSLQRNINIKESDLIVKKMMDVYENNTIFFFISVISFIIMDIISFTQTLTFVRLTGNCKNAIEVLYLALADIAVSLLLVLIALPALIIITHNLTSRNSDSQYYVALVSRLQRQDLSIRDVLKMVAPRLDKNDTEKRSNAKAEQDQYKHEGWYYVIPNVYIAGPEKKPSIKDAVSGLRYTAGDTVVLQKGVINAGKSAEYLSDLLSLSNEIKDVEKVDSYSDDWGNDVYIFKVTSSGTKNYVRILSDYFYVMNDINFFGSDLSKMLRFENKTYEENQLIYTSLTNDIISRVGSGIRFKCDEAEIRTTNSTDFLSDTKNCVNGIAMSVSNIEGMAMVSSYKFKDEGLFPILPTALSSLFLTFSMYIVTFTWIFLPHIRSLFLKYTEGGDDFFVKHVFTISYFVLSPFVYFFLQIKL